MAPSSSTGIKWSSQIFGHPLMWLFLTLLLVLIAYIWMPEGSDKPVVEPVKKVTPEQFENNLQQAGEILKEESMPITRESDEQRSNEYLQIEALTQQVQPLFEIADDHIANNRWVAPGGSNAWDSFQAILKIDPENSAARSGLSKIRNTLIDNAETAIESGEYAEAEGWLVRLDRIQPGDELQEDLRADIRYQIETEAQAKLAQQAEDERQGKIALSLAQAKQEEQPFTFDFNKVRDLYTRVLELDPENHDAQQGLRRLADKQLDNAEILIRADSLERAQQLLEGAAENDPGNKRISGIQLAFETRMQQREQEELLAQQKAEAEELARAKLEEEIRAKQAEEEAIKAQEAAEQEAEAAAAPEPEESPETEVAATDAVVEKTPEPEIQEDPVEAEKQAREAEEQALLKKQQDQLETGIKAYYSGEYNTSFELLYPLAEAGFARAQFRIGIMYRYGRSVSINQDLAEKWFTVALPSVLNLAQQGEAWAQTDLGTAYEFGISLQQDYERAAHWYQQAADQGYAGAQTNLGVLYATGDGVSYDRAKAIFWLKKAAAQGDRVATENLQILGG